MQLHQELETIQIERRDSLIRCPTVPIPCAWRGEVRAISIYLCVRFRSNLKKSVEALAGGEGPRNGPVPSLKHSRMPCLVRLLCPVFGSTRMNSIPSGTGKSLADLFLSIWVMKETQIGEAAREPVSSSPIDRSSSNPTQTPVIYSGV